MNPPLAPAATPMILRIWKPKWEKALPKKYTISATVESNSLKLKVELETTDTLERKSVNSQVDSGATEEFIDHDYGKSCQFVETLGFLTLILRQFTKPILRH